MGVHSPTMSALLSGAVISGLATGGSATGAGRRRDAAAGDAFAHIAHGWLWIQSHAVTLNTKNCIKYPVVRRIGQ
jgi:hypothetical protein